MDFRDIFNTTREAIESGQWNPYLGISIRNKYFTPEAIAAFAAWGVDHARDGFALLIVDILQRINNEVFDKSNVEKALSKAFRQSDAVLDACRAAVASLPPEKRDRITILEWPDIMDEAYSYNTKLIFDSFRDNEPFRDYIIRSVTGNLGGIVTRLNEEKIVTLCDYVLYELSEFFCGFTHRGIHYDLCVYPGSISFLTRDLLSQDFFKPIHAQLRHSGPQAHAEVYVG